MSQQAKPAGWWRIEIGWRQSGNGNFALNCGGYSCVVFKKHDLWKYVINNNVSKTSAFGNESYTDAFSAKRRVRAKLAEIGL